MSDPSDTPAADFDTSAILPLVAGAWQETQRRIAIEVRGASMAPLIRPGDTLTLQMTPPGKLRAGDVFAFERDGRIVVHRLIMRRRTPAGWRLCEKGDGLTGWNWVEEGAALGRVEEIRRGEQLFDLQGPRSRFVSTLLAQLWSLRIAAHELLRRGARRARTWR
jgi:hypothetical protein